MSEKTNKITYTVNADLWRQFSILAATLGTTKQALLQVAIKHLLEWDKENCGQQEQ